MLKLPDVTLITVTAIAIEEAVEALGICLRGVEFGAAKLLSPSRPGLLPAGVEHVPIPPIDVVGYSKFILAELHRHFTTSHCLVVQADGFILNPGIWTDEFLDYDYVGAPWPEQVRVRPGDWLMDLDRNRVGNGGFSLRSHKLMTIAAEIDFDSLDLPIRSEDLVLCHYSYDVLHARGVRYASVDLAARFSVEIPAPQHRDRLDGVFGFHGKRLLPEVLKRFPPTDFVSLRQRLASAAPPMGI